MMFICEQQRAIADNGTLEGVGVVWSEPRWIVERILFGIGVFTGLAGIAVGLVGLATPEPLFVAALGAGIVWVAWELMNTAVELSGRERRLMFLRNRHTHAPKGLSTWRRRHRWMISAHYGVASVEAEALHPFKPNERDYTHGVRLCLRSGEIVHVAKNLEPDQAHMLAVQLTTALAVLRDDMASNAHGWAVDVQVPQGPAAGRRRPGRLQTAGSVDLSGMGN